jgi:hypothetical protein
LYSSSPRGSAWPSTAKLKRVRRSEFSARAITSSADSELDVRSAEPVAKVMVTEAAPARGLSPAAPFALGWTMMLRVRTPGGGGVSASTRAVSSSSFNLNMTPWATAGRAKPAASMPAAVAEQIAKVAASRFISMSSTDDGGDQASTEPIDEQHSCVLGARQGVVAATASVPLVRARWSMAIGRRNPADGSIAARHPVGVASWLDAGYSWKPVAIRFGKPARPGPYG